MARFTIPREVYHGVGSLEELKDLKGERAVLCLGGGSMKRLGFVDRACEYLESAGIQVFLIEDIEPDPSIETVERGARQMEEFQPDWIVAMGGGSPIDAAKAMWVRYEHPEVSFDEIRKSGDLPKLRDKARFCAIPSTSGTASEVTACAVITDYSTGIKIPLAGPEIVPDIAIVDPDLAETMPPKLAAHTGMDALTHAIETYVSAGHSNFSDALAARAIVLITDNLVTSYHGDVRARCQMHEASTMAGMAFSNTGLGITHSIAHKTGAAFIDCGAHITHGAANAMYLPKVIAFNAREPGTRARYAQIADLMSLGSTSEEEKVHLLISKIRDLDEMMRIPHSISSYGKDSYPCDKGFVPRETFERRLPGIAANALGDACTPSNPRQPSPEEMQRLIACCFDDSPVDF